MIIFTPCDYDLFCQKIKVRLIAMLRKLNHQPSSQAVGSGEQDYFSLRYPGCFSVPPIESRKKPNGKDLAPPQMKFYFWAGNRGFPPLVHSPFHPSLFPSELTGTNRLLLSLKCCQVVIFCVCPYLLVNNSSLMQLAKYFKRMY